MRSIAFSEAEVTRAVIEFAQYRRQRLPPGEVLRLDVHTDPLAADLVIRDDFGETKTVGYSGAELAASLVHFCLERRIRLPAKGTKFVEVIAGAPTLVIWVAEPEARRGLSRPARGIAS